MTQNVLDYSLNPSGIELMDTYLAGMADNMLTTNSGVSRPSYAQAGTFWIDTSVSPWVLKQFNGTNDVVVGTLDQTNLYFTAQRALGDKNGNDITSTYVTTTGTAAKATADANGNVITSTYVTTTGTAAKATADADGNTISSTYSKLAGNNTFSGDNTFSETTRFSGNTYFTAPYEILDAVLGTTPSQLKTANYGVVDKNNTWLGGFEQVYDTGGFIYKQIGQVKPDGSPNAALFQIGYDNNLNEFVGGSSGVLASLVRLGMPNYTATVSKSKDVSYTAESNGFLIGFDMYAGTGGSTAYVVVNGVNVRETTNQDNYSINTWCYPIGKNDSYYYSGNSTMLLYFVPCYGG